MPSINIAGNRQYFTMSRPVSPTEPCLICLHGSGGTHKHWPARLRSIKNVCVMAIDLPGHGRSQGAGHETVSAYANAVEAFVRKMSLARVILMGHSLGGAVAQVLALAAPAWLEGVILVGTGARLRVAAEILDASPAAVGLVIDWACGPSARPSLVDSLRRELRNTPANVTHGDFKACNGFDIMHAIGNVRLPTLIISGSRDRLTPPKYGDYLAASIPGATHVVIPDAGHMMALEFPDVFIKHVMAFVIPG